MVDPVTGAAFAGGVLLATVKSSVERVVGPSADQLGQALGRYTEYRLRNVGRIMQRAEVKSGGRDGEVHPRVAHKLLEDGSYCDTEVMVEYLSGVLAASRTHDGRDDRAVVWSNLVTSMSSLQLRAHCVLYREWAAAMEGREDLNLGIDTDRDKMRLVADGRELYQLLDPGGSSGDVLNHAIVGLIRTGMLGDSYYWGAADAGTLAAGSGYDFSLVVFPSVAGIELYGWAMGEPDMTPYRFPNAGVLEMEPPLARLRNVTFPAAPTPPSSAAHD